jgi:hypothetical protein
MMVMMHEDGGGSGHDEYTPFAKVLHARRCRKQLVMPDKFRPTVPAILSDRCADAVSIAHRRRPSESSMSWDC